jgi:diguanylate cyclase (GGDEF)-like protein
MTVDREFQAGARARLRRAARSARVRILASFAAAALTLALAAAGAASSWDPRVTLVAAAAGLGLLGLSSRLLTGLVFRPLEALADACRLLRGDERGARAPLLGGPELRAAAYEVNELAALAEELDELAATDPVSGLANDRRFGEALGIEVERARRQGEPMALAMIDLDAFRPVNELHGRAFGDELLRRVADGLRLAVRVSDLAARVGGDEFGLVLGGASAQEAELILERARAAVAAVVVEGAPLGFAAGLACFPEDAADAPALRACAEAALTTAKDDADGKTRRYDVRRMRASHVAGLRLEVMALLSRPGAMSPVFQPIASLATGRIKGYEALTRFSGLPRRTPQEWFVLARRCGLGPALEARAIELALGAHRTWSRGGELSLNLSPAALGSAEVMAVLPDDLSGFVIELTEHELAADAEELQAELAALRERGAQIAVDDAGAGYAGLQQVMRVRPNLIKLDRSLIEAVHADPAKAALIDSFVRFARRTGAEVCAEGIEREQDLLVLADLDVAYGQGFVLGPPAGYRTEINPSIAVTLMQRSLGSKLDLNAPPDSFGNTDQRLVVLSERLYSADTVEQVRDVVGSIAPEIDADDVCVLLTNGPGELTGSLPERDWLPEPERLNVSLYPTLTAVLVRHEAHQVLLEQEDAGIGELSLLGASGYHSMLMVPIVARGRTHGALVAFSQAERPWSRTETNRARLIAYQLGPALDRLELTQR